MGPIALFVVVVLMPLLALGLFVAALLGVLLVRLAAEVPLASWAGFAGGLLLGGAIWRSRRRARPSVT